MSAEGSVLVAGVGPGLGIAVATRFARDGYRVAMLAHIDRGRSSTLRPMISSIAGELARLPVS
jgi:NAD(P)-dependent dehydrogenase (short-subunit alcohol dehydrogenase family)